jgi:hypothetical protein
MNNKKTTVIVVSVVAGLCVLSIIAACVAFKLAGDRVSKSMTSDPQAAATAGHQIADYDLPAGFSEQMAMNFMGYQIVMIGSDKSSTSMLIELAQFTNSNLSPEEMQKSMQAYIDQQSGTSSGMQTVETRTMTIRGVETSVIIREGKAQAGYTLRQLIAAFPGKSGQAMVIIQDVTQDWDDDLVDTFIESIH